MKFSPIESLFFGERCLHPFKNRSVNQMVIDFGKNWPKDDKKCQHTDNVVHHINGHACKTFGRRWQFFIFQLKNSKSDFAYD